MQNVSILKEKMQDTLFRWMLNIFLAAIIFINAEIGRVLGHTGDPLAISLVWPATGFSLAAILLFGFQTWPGIFFGNLLYNLHYFHPTGSMIPYSESMFALLASASVSLGSLAEAVFAGYIMQKYASKGYFTSVKDIFTFVVFAGLLAPIFASIIGISTLYIYEASYSMPTFELFINFWLGDMLGILILTPLLVVWSTHETNIQLKEHLVEGFFMAISFVLLGILAFGYSLPVGLLYVPLCVWAAYRFLMHGATLMIFFTSLMIILPTSMGIGTFVEALTRNPLLISVIYLEVIVAVSLLVAAQAVERKTLTTLLKGKELNIEMLAAMHTKDAEKMAQEIAIKEKLSLLHEITSKVFALLQFPMKMCHNFMQMSLDTIKNGQNEVLMQKGHQKPNFIDNIYQTLEMLKKYLQEMQKSCMQTHEMVEQIKEQTVCSVIQQKQSVFIDINTLVEAAVGFFLQKVAKEEPPFHLTLVKRLDQKIQTSFLDPEELAHALINIFRFSLASLKKKHAQNEEEYEPILEIKTGESVKDLYITIRDNGLGLSEPFFTQAFISFEHMTLPDAYSDTLSGADLLGLSLAHDIITKIYRGTIRVSSGEDCFFQIEITLPK